MKSHVLSGVKVADEVWIATALLHREHPDAVDFSIDQIVGRVRKEGLHEPLRPGIRDATECSLKLWKVVAGSIGQVILTIHRERARK